MKQNLSANIAIIDDQIELLNAELKRLRKMRRLAVKLQDMGSVDVTLTTSNIDVTSNVETLETVSNA